MSRKKQKEPSIKLAYSPSHGMNTRLLFKENLFLEHHLSINLHLCKSQVFLDNELPDGKDNYFEHLEIDTRPKGHTFDRGETIIYPGILLYSVYIIWGSLKKENQWDICVYIHSEIYFKELTP